MNTDELRNKVLKLALAYRQERIRNEYFEKALKNANTDLAKTKKVASESEQLVQKNEKLRGALTVVSKEI